MERTITLHSLIDVITNSSTEVFLIMKENAVATMFEFLNEILRVAGSDQKAEDLFEVYVDRDWDMAVDRYLDDATIDVEQDYVADMDEDEVKMVTEYNSRMEESWKKANEYASSVVVPWLKSHPEKVPGSDYDYRSMENFLVIKAKDESKSTMELFDKFMSVMDIEAIREG